MMELFQSHDVHVMTLPPFSDCVDDGVIKDIQIKDWLRREPLQVDIREITSHIEGRKIMVIGAAGTVGREIVRQLAALSLASKNPMAVDRRLMIVRWDEIYPYNSHCLITMAEICQLLLEVRSLGENGGVYLLSGIPVLSAESISHAQVMKCVVKECDYEKCMQIFLV